MQALSPPPAQPEAVWFTPELFVSDQVTAYWIRQATLRLRRELCWVWRQQAGNPVTEALNRNNRLQQRLEFFDHDETAHYLTLAIYEDRPEESSRERGTLPWVADELRLSPAEIFVTALALLHGWDAAAADVISAVEGDARRSFPTLALAQRLWEEPGALAALGSPWHLLFRMGLVRADSRETIDWRTPLSMPALIAQKLLAAPNHSAAISSLFRVVRGDQQGGTLPEAAQLVALRACEKPVVPHAVPLRAASSQAQGIASDLTALLEGFSQVTGRPIYCSQPAKPGVELQTAAAVAWLDGADLHLDCPSDLPFQSVPIYTLAFWEQERLQIPGWRVLPPLEVPSLDLRQRLQCWRDAFPADVAPPSVALADCAFRFRFDRLAIQEIARALLRQPGPVSADQLTRACRLRAEASPGNLATRVKPRFSTAELVLPPTQQRQFDELLTALSAVSQVHTDWGTGRVWDEAGISALFAGPPGTGKTMAAEALASALGLPMFRVDLSQVVNKYIGETEKNLRRLFDSMEECDSLLFFDEAESLFGQRMQARNANDRFANMEISYLLQRMERFRGVAILATNRRKDLDEAFLRRLRFVIEFPLPDAGERKRIWTSALPAEVDATGLNVDFLSRQFALSGGHIRSIILHACLQSAGRSAKPELSMETVMLSVRREYQKLDRTLTREQCGKWSAVLDDGGK